MKNHLRYTLVMVATLYQPIGQQLKAAAIVAIQA